MERYSSSLHRHQLISHRAKGMEGKDIQMCVPGIRFPYSEKDVSHQGNKPNSSTNSIIRQHLLDQPIRNLRLLGRSHDQCIVEDRINDITSPGDDTLRVGKQRQPVWEDVRFKGHTIQNVHPTLNPQRFIPLSSRCALLFTFCKIFKSRFDRPSGSFR